MLVLGLIMIFLLRAVGAITSLVVGGMATALVLAGSWLAFDGHGWLLDPVQPSLMALLVFVTAEGISYMHSETERRQVRGAFKQYLAPELVDQLARRPELLRLGGEQRTMTIMFCDVRGFTTISEHYKDDPQGLTALVNRLLTPMTDVVLGCRGTIDKYIGDCIMAFWNAPLDDLEHAANACRAALGMHAAIRKLNATLAEENAAQAPAPEPFADTVGEDRSRDFAELQRAANSGFAKAQYALGKAYRDGGRDLRRSASGRPLVRAGGRAGLCAGPAQCRAAVRRRPRGTSRSGARRGLADLGRATGHDRRRGGARGAAQQARSPAGP